MKLNIQIQKHKGPTKDQKKIVVPKSFNLKGTLLHETLPRAFEISCAACQVPTRSLMSLKRIGFGCSRCLSGSILVHNRIQQSYQVSPTIANSQAPC